MGDELLPYYNEELTHIRHMAAEFAREHPKIAARLRISTDTIEDTHVERPAGVHRHRPQHLVAEDEREAAEGAKPVLEQPGGGARRAVGGDRVGAEVVALSDDPIELHRRRATGWLEPGVPRR